MSEKHLTYADSGVDIKEEEKTVKTLIDKLSYVRKGIGAPLTGIGHYAGLLDFGSVARSQLSLRDAEWPSRR